MLGSTRLPPCKISALPAATRRRAACLAGSMRARQRSTSTCRAASPGQIVLPRRSISMETIASSSARSSAVTRPRRHRVLQNRTWSQLFDHLVRQVNLRPHLAQIFVGVDAMPAVSKYLIEQRRAGARGLVQARLQNLRPSASRRGGLLSWPMGLMLRAEFHGTGSYVESRAKLKARLFFLGVPAHPGEVDPVLRRLHPHWQHLHGLRRMDGILHEGRGLSSGRGRREPHLVHPGTSAPPTA